jgi:prepilin-type N-terminal cleavage/methylation domain-containing protein
MWLKTHERSLEMVHLRHVRPLRVCVFSRIPTAPLQHRYGFTLVEIMIVAVIIVIAAAMAVPLVGSAASIQIRSASNMVASDLEYAKSMAVSRGQSYSVVFDESTESYRIEDQAGSVIAHPVKKGFDYVVDFRNDRRLNKVDIFDVDFNSTGTIKFDYLGSPYDGGNNPLNIGVVTLKAGGTTVTVNVEPVTGFISVGD